MKILLFGANGHIGSAIRDELLARGHEITAASRTGTGPDLHGLSWEACDVLDTEAVAALAKGHDAVASAVGPKVGVENDEKTILGAARSLIEALPAAGVRRLVVLGGAGSLEVAPGVTLVSTPQFPAQWKANALAQSAALDLYRTVGGLDWTFVSPAALIEPGPRTGEFRVGGDRLLKDGEGKSRVSIADYAVAFADAIEDARTFQRRICVAY
ncbi:NAD(P)H-binding protein [Glycomyces sp. NPDC049804]|uniref:NAD(P)-dependent oxidoreductase n=1 Tax=Glycomyces sp. NPDC049804 TaxID=3154363 RepID=UPI0034206782